MKQILDHPVTDEEFEFAQSHLGSVDFELSVLRGILRRLSATEDGAPTNERARLFKLLETVLPMVETIERLESERLELLKSMQPISGPVH
jgi:hypothetical protein